MSNKLIQLWSKLPVIARSIVVGMLVQILGIVPIFLLLQTNVQMGDQIPWTLPLGLIYLFLFVNFLRGKGWPAAGAASRRERSCSPSHIHFLPP
jgi:hypothetical protein